MSNHPNDQLLRLALRANAGFSTLCGVIAVAGASSLAPALGVPEPVALTSLGIQLWVFAALLLFLASRPVIRPAFALAVVAADALWVIGTIPVVGGGALTATGDWTASLIAFVVGSFGVLQFIGVRRMQAGRPATA